MSNYNFDDLVNEKFCGNPKKVLDKYKYNSVDSILKRIDNSEDNDIDELENIVNEIVLWKLNRMVFIDDDVLKELKMISNINSPSDAIGIDLNRTKRLVRGLIKSKGVKLPMASSLMHFFNPNVFPIFDQRAYRVIYLANYNANNNVENNIDLYVDYLKKCIAYYNKNQLDKFFPFSEIDKYLYQLDKEIGNKVKM